MRAVVLRTLGEPPEVAEHSDPVAGPGRSVVRVTAAPITPVDLLCASGTASFGRPEVPYVPGVQGVGVVEDSGALPAGTRVWFVTSAGMAAGDGSLAERCAVADDDLVPVSVALPDAALGALGHSAVAAWMALTWRGGLRPGEHVLVLGAGGVVGQVAVGAARLLGAGRVVAVARSQVARERALAAGADAVVDPSAGTDELAARVAAATGGRLDLVVDPVFGRMATAASRVLSPGGRLVNLGGASGDAAAFSSAVLRSRSAAVLGYTNSALTREQRRDALTTVAGHAAAGRLPVASEPVRLADAPEAWRRQATGDLGVRLVVTP